MSDGVEAFFPLRQQLLGLLELARTEQWDELVVALPHFQEMTKALPVVDFSGLPPVEQQKCAAFLLQLKNEQDELIELAQSRRDELAASLQGLHNAGKLDKAYRM